MAQPFETFAHGVSLGIEMRKAFENTRLLLQDRADRAKSEQVANESAEAFKKINAPVAAVREQFRSYAESVMLDPSKRDPKLEENLVKMSALAQQQATMDKLDYTMNVIAANPDNKYVQESMKPVASATIAQMQTFQRQTEMASNEQEGGAQREHEASESKELRFHQANMEQARQLGDYEREEQRTENQKEVLDYQDELMRARAKEGVTGKGKGSAATKFLDDLDFAESRAKDAVKDIPDEQWAEDAEAAGVDPATYKRAWQKSKARRELMAAGYKEEQVDAVFGGAAAAPKPGEEGKETKPGEALVERIGQLLESKDLTPRAKSRLQKKREAILARQLASQTSKDEEDAAKILGTDPDYEEISGTERTPESYAAESPAVKEVQSFVDKYFTGYGDMSEDEQRQLRFKIRNAVGEANVPHMR